MHFLPRVTLDVGSFARALRRAEFFTLDSVSALQEQTEAYNAAKGRCVLYVLKRWEGLERALSLVLSLSVVEDPTAD